MNGHELLSDAAIRDAFERRARRADTAGLRDTIIGQTAVLPQRRAWRVALEDVFALPRTRRLVIVVTAISLLAALTIGLLLVGQRGPALRTGLTAYISGGDVYLQDPSSNRAVKILDDPDVSFTRVTWIDGDRRLAVEDGTGVTILDPVTGERMQRRADDNWLYDVTWSADGRSFAYVQDTATSTGGIVVVDAMTGQSRRLSVDPALGDPGSLGDVTMSPDGRWLAATAWVGGGELVGDGVVRIDARTGAATWIVRPPGCCATTADQQERSISDLAWSPDSSRLAYVAGMPGGNGPDGDTPGTRWIVVVGADGSEPVTITAPSPGTLLGFYHLGDQLLPAWSPDGQWIAFRADPGLSIVRPDGSDRRDLIGDPVGPFTWSPDGSQIEFMRAARLDDAAGALWELDVTTGEARPLGVDSVASVAIQAIGKDQSPPTLPVVAISATQPPATATLAPLLAPASAPPADPAADGWSLLVTMNGESGCRQLELGDLSAGTLRPLTDCLSFGVESRAPSPDGKHILRVRDGHLVLQRVADGTQREITADDRFVSYTHGMAWSPRGTWFAWTICPTPSSCTTSIEPVDASGGSHTLSARWASWSPDEKRLALETPDGVLIANGDGADPRPLGRDVPSVSDWAPDGSQLAYVHDGNVWVVGVDGSRARKITQFEFGGIGEVAWSPDGQHLAVIHDSTAWVAGLDGSMTRLDLGPIDGLGLGASWSPNGRMLAVGLSSPDTATTVLVPLDGRLSTALPGAGYVTWSTDSRFMAFVGPDGTVNVANADGSGGHPVLSPLAAPGSLTWVRRGAMSGAAPAP